MTNPVGQGWEYIRVQRMSFEKRIYRLLNLRSVVRIPEVGETTPPERMAAVLTAGPLQGIELSYMEGRVSILPMIRTKPNFCEILDQVCALLKRHSPKTTYCRASAGNIERPAQAGERFICRFRKCKRNATKAASLDPHPA